MKCDVTGRTILQIEGALALLALLLLLMRSFSDSLLLHALALITIDSAFCTFDSTLETLHFGFALGALIPWRGYKQFASAFEVLSQC